MNFAVILVGLGCVEIHIYALLYICLHFDEINLVLKQNQPKHFAQEEVCALSYKTEFSFPHLFLNT